MDEDGWTAIKPYVQNMKMNYRVLLGQRRCQHCLRRPGLAAHHATDRPAGQDCIGSRRRLHGERGIQECDCSTAQRASRPAPCCFWRHLGLAYEPKRPVTRSSASRLPRASPSSAAAPADFALKAELQPGFHVNSNMPGDDYLIPIKTDLEQRSAGSRAGDLSQAANGEAVVFDQPDFRLHRDF